MIAMIFEALICIFQFLHQVDNILNDLVGNIERFYITGFTIVNIMLT